jgi:galactofuranose transport system ATP-binding protein
MTEQESPILEVREVTKRFPGVVALDGVSFQLRADEVHALVGENGAGKSTLIKVITGLYRPDEGRILFNGEEVSFASPREAQEAGISTIYQEINLIPLRSVAQNIFLGREPRTSLGLTDTGRMKREAADLLERYGIDADVDAPVRSLGVAVQQMVAITKAVSMEARVVIMDEPTSALEAHEVETLFQVIRRLRNDGVGVVYVSHRLEELYEICERVTVLRDGKVVHEGDLAELPRLELIATMLGREVPEVEKRVAAHEAREARVGEPVLEANNLTAHHAPKGVSIDVRKGEVVGLAGLLGSGRTETAKAIFGAQPLESGTVEVDGRDVNPDSPSEAIKSGLAFLPEDRKTEGIIPDLSVRENIIAAALPRLSRAGFVSKKEQDELVERFMTRLNIKASSPDQPVGELSGGNQQKVLLARWLCLEPKVLILDEPTQGIDVGAKAEVQQLIAELAEGGLGVVMIDSEPEEILEGSDRVVVLRDGAVAGTLSGNELTEENLVGAIAGSESSQPKKDGGDAHE